MNRKTRRVLIAACVIAGLSAVLILRGILLPEGSTEAPGDPVEKAVLAYVDTTSAVLAGVALHNGYFQQQGLEVAARPHAFGRTALQDMLEGNADFATVADLPIMRAIMRGEKIFILATIQASKEDHGVVARRETGIATAEDLQGKKIAVTPGTTSEFFLDAFLAGHGIAGEEVETVYLEPEDALDALASGRVDAVSTFQPFLVRLEKSFGNRAISFYDENIYGLTFNIVASQEFVRTHPRKVRKLLRGLAEAERFVGRHPAEAQNIVARYSTIEPAVIGELWPSMKLSLTLDQSLVLALEDESRWAINRGRVDEQEIPNYLEYIYFDGLESIHPGAVRILR